MSEVTDQLKDGTLEITIDTGSGLLAKSASSWHSASSSPRIHSARRWLMPLHNSLLPQLDPIIVRAQGLQGHVGCDGSV